mmetsp:Transcript_49560/g.117622  ORF Transcript_49560/g.117622 Transcript_49560/m.117622 type:complete len:200 (-) Transcript_49560:215-814(-)
MLGSKVEGRLASAVHNRRERLVLANQRLDDRSMAAQRRKRDTCVPMAVLGGKLHTRGPDNDADDVFVPSVRGKVQGGALLAVNHVDQGRVGNENRRDHPQTACRTGHMQAVGAVVALLGKHPHATLCQKQLHQGGTVVVALGCHVIRRPAVGSLLGQLPVVKIEKQLACLDAALLCGGGLMQGGPAAIDQARGRLFRVE